MYPRLPWYLATTLPERLAAGAPTATDDDRAEKRLALWTELTPLAGDPDTLDDRLASLDVTSASLIALLGETNASLAARFATEPPWHETFRTWWAVGRATPAGARIVGPHLGLVEVARPLLEGAVRQLQEQVTARLVDVAAADPVLADADQVARVLRATSPVFEVLGHITRTLVLELNVARVEQRLDGCSPEERFEAFTAILAGEDNALAIWREYPVLARLVVTQLTFWLRTRLELLDALIADLPSLRAELLAGHAPMRIERIEFGAGDKHRRGRSVAVVSFDDGSVVFKPRSLAIDVAFDGMLGWLNEHGLPHQIRRFGVLDRGTYGWAEFVDSAVRTDGAGGDRYTWRLGALTALLYLLHAADFHFENILASGEHPVLVDLEALLHTVKSAAIAKVDGTGDIASTALVRSVHSIGVLPVLLLVTGEEGTFGMDVSGMGGHGGQLTPMPVPFYEDSGTDTMRVVNRRLKFEAERNLPLATNGEPMNLISRDGHFMAGFTDAYRRLCSGGAELLAANGPLTPFRHVSSRLIARPTHIYGRLLLESTHPDFLRDALDRDRSLARLCSGHDVPYGDDMVRDEIAELRLGDIPMFSVEASTGVIRTGLDDEAIGFEAPPPLEQVRNRVDDLGDPDLRFQQWVIRSSVAATTMGSADARWPNWQRARERAGGRSGDFADEARRVSGRLCELALRDGRNVGWIGLGLINDAFWQLTPAYGDSYIGVAGIAHALSTVAGVTGDPVSCELAVAAFDQLVRRMDFAVESLSDATGAPGQIGTDIGAFGPVGGLIYTLSHAAARHGRPDYAQAAQVLLPVLDDLVAEDYSFDLMSGSAGAILSLLSLASVAPGAGALDVARRAADRLLDMRTETAAGWGWITPINPDEPLAGMSHGASGIALAFARLNEVIPDPRYVEAARQALRYEASTWHEELHNWRDLRPANLGGRTVMSAWCHGAPGVVLARRELLRLGTVPDLTDGLERDRHRGVLATMATGLADNPVTGLGNHSLCHGDLGNLLALERAHDPQKEPEIAEALPAIWHTLLIEGRANGWLCGVPQGIETPGLMTGLAGIVWGLARYADPEGVPDLLTLEPPR